MCAGLYLPLRTQSKIEIDPDIITKQEGSTEGVVRIMIDMNDVFWEIPATIDLESKLKDHPPSFRWTKIDYFYHIIDLIVQLTEHEDLDNNAAFVNLSSRQLQAFNYNYKQYVQYLIDQYIIVTDKHFIIGAKSLGYKLNPFLGYGYDIANIRVRDHICRRKKFKELREAKKSATTNYPALTKWFNSNLKIDVDAAIRKIDEMFPKPTGGIKGPLRYHRKYAKRPDQGSKRLKALGAIKRLAKKEFYYTIDDNVGRFHSNLTNIKRELRHYITYDHQKLVNIDIKSAQPFLSQMLLQPKFYLETKANTLTIHQFPLIKQVLTTPPCTKRATTHYVMLVKAVQNIDIQEFKRYSGFIKSGLFYEKLHDLLYPRAGRIDKAAFKIEVYRLLFSKNRSQSDFKKLFKSHFPHIYRIFMLYKRSDHSLLARLLQSMESKIMIQAVSGRISREAPELPIFTIHDSMATIVGREEYVKNVLIEEAKRLTGMKPKVGVEYWG